ncbi:hypothetical protein [Paracoccus sp. S1E-3]|uniref:hypothetical protein n=1 Tax=Paracoccus sp. S1E-3 TaxID=2756130 RepID=UPI0015EE7721|nr:hypothetical protein [Paracoccus sp. S1E-3]MBA4490786.1 hypothetical protein [Paracoccus sp. S1E-3]
MILAAFLTAGLAAAPGLDALTTEIDRLVLAGRPMQPALLLDLRRLPDAGDRMKALIYLRRSGLMTGPAVPLEGTVFLRPAVTAAPPDAGRPAPTEDAADEG